MHCKNNPSTFPGFQPAYHWPILFLAGNIFSLWSLEFSLTFPFPALNSHRIIFCASLIRRVADSRIIKLKRRVADSAHCWYGERGRLCASLIKRVKDSVSRNLLWIIFQPKKCSVCMNSKNISTFFVHDYLHSVQGFQRRLSKDARPSNVEGREAHPEVADESHQPQSQRWPLLLQVHTNALIGYRRPCGRRPPSFAKPAC